MYHAGGKVRFFCIGTVANCFETIVLRRRLQGSRDLLRRCVNDSERLFRMFYDFFNLNVRFDRVLSVRLSNGINFNAHRRLVRARLSELARIRFYPFRHFR